MIETPLGPPLGRRASRAVFALLLLWAAGLRFYLIHANAHPGASFDERFLVAPAARIALHRDFTPSTYMWGALPQYWAGAVTGAAKEASNLWQSLGGRPLVRLRGETPLTPHGYVLARAANALAGLATVALTYLLARRIYGPAPALTAMALVATSRYMVFKSKDATADAMLTCMATLALLLIVRVREAPTWGRFLCAGAAIGLTVGSKYNGWPVAAPLVVVALGTLGPVAALARLAAAAAVSLVAFAAVNPYSILNWHDFQGDLRAIRSAYRRKGRARTHSQWEMWPVLWSCVQTLFVGFLPGVLAGFGLLAAFVRRRLAEMAPATFVAVYLLWFNTTIRNPIAHNYLILVPSLAILASGAAWRALDALARWLGGGEARRLQVGAAGAALLVLPVMLAHSAHEIDQRRPLTTEGVQVWVMRRLLSEPRLISEGVRLDRRLVGRRVAVVDSLLAWPRERLFLEGEFLLADLSRIEAMAPALPGPIASYRRLLLDPRLKLLERLGPSGPFQRGPTYAIFEVAPPGLSLVAEAEVPLGSFRLSGSAGFDGSILWIRDCDSAARAPVPLSLAPGELLSVEARGGGDDSVLGGEGLLGVRLGIDRIGTRAEVERNTLRSYASEVFPVRSSSPTVELVYDGSDGGRAYFVSVRVKRWVAAASLAAEPVARRQDEIALVQRAGL